VQRKQLSSLSAGKGVKPQASSGGIGTPIQIQIQVQTRIQIGLSAAVGSPGFGFWFSVFGFRFSYGQQGTLEPNSALAKNMARLAKHIFCQI